MTAWPHPSQLVAGRHCGDCSLCCTLLRVEELNKAALQPCGNCSSSGGCGIYPHWPHECRQYFCGYRLDPSLGEEWKPSRSHLVVTFEEYTAGVVILVDPLMPEAWRREPFLSQIQAWADAAVADGSEVAVWQGDDKIIVGRRPRESLLPQNQIA